LRSTQTSNSLKILPMGAESFPADGQRVRQRDRLKRRSY